MNINGPLIFITGQIFVQLLDKTAKIPPHFYEQNINTKSAVIFSIISVLSRDRIDRFLTHKFNER